MTNHDVPVNHHVRCVSDLNVTGSNMINTRESQKENEVRFIVYRKVLQLSHQSPSCR